jgi:hypothetical protein
VPILLALASALLGKPLKGGMVVVGGINLGGSIEPVHNPVDVVEHALTKGASAILMPVSCRRQLVDLSDDVATKVQVLFYSDATVGLRKGVVRRVALARPTITRGATLRAHSLTVRNHDFPEMTAALEMSVCRLGLGERECPVDHWAQAVHRDRAVHGLEIGAASDADRAERDAAACQQQGIKPCPRW